MINWYAAEKVSKFEHEQRVRAAATARMVAEAKRSEQAEASEAPRVGLLRRLTLVLGLR
ncbi:MAG: hypothetical protein DIU80_024170 [Chloroflexota bacterium]|mgnify:CR=1 FL=1